MDLFVRRARGLELTETGRALLPAAEAMAQAAAKLRLASGGQEDSLTGTVRLTASLFVAHYMLQSVIQGIQREEPDIQIELVASDTSENLLYREADIAIRMYRPTQLDIVARQLGELEIGLFAARSYIERRGIPKTFAELFDHDLVGYDRDERIIQGMRAQGAPISRQNFVIRCDAQTVYWEFVRAGCGIGAGQKIVGRADPDVVEVLTDLPVPALPVWLAAPDALHRTPRIRRVWELLADALTPLVS